MKNWFAMANCMYRHVFVKSLASSASRVVVRTIFKPKAARRAPWPDGRLVDVGTHDLRQVRSSSSAWPSAIRSGQKATSTRQPRAATAFGDYSVVPG